MESPFLSDAGLWESWKGDRPPSSAGRGLGRPASARSTRYAIKAGSAEETFPSGHSRGLSNCALLRPCRVNSGVTIERHNMGAMKLNLYYGRDLFHTLINVRTRALKSI